MFWAAWSHWPWSELGVGLHDLQWSLPTQVILWFFPKGKKTGLYLSEMQASVFSCLPPFLLYASSPTCSLSIVQIYTYFTYENPLKGIFNLKLAESIFSHVTNWKDLTHLGKTSPVRKLRECTLSPPLGNAKEGLGGKKLFIFTVEEPPTLQ